MTSHRSSNALGAPFWWLLGGSAVSFVGDGVLLVALPLLAATLTRSPLVVSGVALAESLPWLLVALPAGALVDRLNRGRVMIVADLARFAALAALGTTIATGHASIPDDAMYRPRSISNSFPTGR